MHNAPRLNSPVRGTLATVRHDQLDWLPWAMPGSHFKLLSADPASGRFSLMIKLDPGLIAPPHRHVGAVEGYILEGGFHYHDAPEVRYTAGAYLLENDGAVHQPVSPEGALMFAVFHGPVEGLDAQGEVTGRIGWRWHVETWNAAGGDFRPAQAAAGCSGDADCVHPPPATRIRQSPD